MARPHNTVKSEEMRLALSPDIKSGLEKIARTGLFGLNPNEVAVRLIERGLPELAEQVRDTRKTLKQL